MCTDMLVDGEVGLRRLGLPSDEPMWTQEEGMLSSPYDDLKAWEQIIQEQLDRNVTCFRGPPGLWERLAALHAEATGQAVVPAPSRRATTT